MKSKLFKSLILAGCLNSLSLLAVAAPDLPPSSQKINAEAVVVLKRAGGYVPPAQARLDRAPVVILFKNGDFSRRVDNAETGQASWIQGHLGQDELDDLFGKIKKLGFWKWDLQKIEKAVSHQNLITDLPTTSLSITSEGETKTVSIYGLNEYYENFSLPELKKPYEVVRLLEGLSPGKE